MSAQNSTHNIDTQLAHAGDASASLSPGEYWPLETDEKNDQSNTANSNPADKATEESSSRLGTGAIAGIAVGGAVVLALAGGLVYMCGRHKSFKDMLKGNNTNAKLHPESTIYEPTSPGFSEANYPNMNKSPAMSDARFSAMSYTGAYSDRSVSPPPDEHTHSLYGVLASGGQGTNM